MLANVPDSVDKNVARGLGKHLFDKWQIYVITKGYSFEEWTFIFKFYKALDNFKTNNQFGVGHIKLPADINKNVLPLVTAIYSFSFYITGQKSDPPKQNVRKFLVSNVIPALMHKLHKP